MSTIAWKEKATDPRRHGPAWILRCAAAGVVIAGTCFMLDGAASAQNALGGGNALDANLNPYSRINPTIRSRSQQYQQYQARNLLVTGDVAGGRGFRGSVGYSAIGDFRSALGSDDLFQFRSQSATSSLPFVRGGGTRRYLELGMDLNLLEFRRSGSAITSGDVAQQQQRVSPFVYNTERRLEQETISRMLEGEMQRFGEPSTIGFMRTQSGQRVPITASPLRGILANPLQPGLDYTGLSTFDLSQLREDSQSGFAFPTIGEPFPSAFETLTGEARPDQQDGATGEQFPGLSPDQQQQPQPEPQASADRLPWSETRQQSTSQTGRVETQRAAQTPADYQQILERITERYANREGVDLSIDPQLIRGLGEEFTELRRQLRTRALQRDMTGEQSEQPGLDEFGQPDDESIDGQEDGQQPSQSDGSGRLTPEQFLQQRLSEVLRTREPTRQGGAGGVIDSPFGEMSERALERRRAESRQRAGLPAQQYADILSHGQRIEKLSGDTKDWVNDLISRGELALRQGEYFNAEQRFNRALRISRNHPTALAGKAHAQLGAGLHLSSAVTLRTLFTDRPEMIDAEYASNLLPSQKRMRQTIAKIQSQLTENVEPASHGLLLAYIGRQTGDRALINQGLDAIASSTPDDPLLPLLQSIWLHGKSADEAVTGPSAPAESDDDGEDDDGLAEPGK